MWTKILEELHGMVERLHSGGSGACQGAPHKKGKGVSHVEKFVTEGNEKADELAKAGGLLDERFMAEARGETMQQEREEVYAALQRASTA